MKQGIDINKYITNLLKENMNKSKKNFDWAFNPSLKLEAEADLSIKHDEYLYDAK